MKNDIKKRNFIAQGSILAMTGIVCRLIGMLYRIPLIQIIGTIGNGYYTSAYSIYNILLILSSYSLPTAISKVISVRLAKERYNDVRKVLRVAFLYATLIGGSMSCLMFFGSGPIAEFMQKPFCAYAIRTLAPTIWIMAYLGVLRGYFQGSGNMVPTAVSQLLEQVVNAVVSVVMALLLFDYGAKANLIYSETEYSYAYGAAGGTIGTGAGALIALLFFLLMLLLFGRLPEEGESNAYSYGFGDAPGSGSDAENSRSLRRGMEKGRGRSRGRDRDPGSDFSYSEEAPLGRSRGRSRGRGAVPASAYASGPSTGRPAAAGYGQRQRGIRASGASGRGGSYGARGYRSESSLKIAGVLLLTLIPILISSTVYNISTVLDDMIFSRMMAGFGLAGSVVFLWGVFGEYRILFNIPVAISNSLSSSLIPSLTNAVAEQDQRLVVQKIRISSKFVMLISMPSAVGIFVLAEPICALLFSGNDNSLLVNVVRVGSPAIVFFSLSTISNGILQGLGHLSLPLRNSVLALVVHCASLVGLLRVSHDIYTVVIANTIFAMVVCFLNSRSVHRHVRFTMDIVRTYMLPFAASVIMGIVVFFLYRLLTGMLEGGIGISGNAALASDILAMLICICAAVPVYFVTVLLLGTFNKEELLEMPMGLRIYNLAHKLGLM